MDVYQLIERDHATAREMIAQLKTTPERQARTRESLFAEFKAELQAHQVSEESAFYAALKDREETRAETLEAFNEHHIITGLLEELAIMPFGNDQWTAKFGVLAELLEHHLHEEETEVFEAARQTLSQEEARQLGRLMAEKKRLALDSVSAPA